MSLTIYNTLTKKKEDFEPLNPPQVNMYVCGITPYDECHLGHGRAYVAFDLIRRYLEYSDYKVNYIQNITDIDDKIIKKSKELAVSFEQVADKYTESFFEVMDKLNVKKASRYPKATEHIAEMIKWITDLIDKGYAYVIDNDVYYEVEKFEEYGKLSKRKKKDLIAGARVAVDKRKKSPLDFALWKSAKEGEPSWDSPWGKGRPGWHIECSIMSTKYLGEQFDIHGGGRDLIFPHHENEIAQTEAGTGKVPLVKYWMHNGFININKQKMSKSLGNFFTLKDIFEKFDPMVIRFFLLSTHYRSPIDYSDKEIGSAKEAYGRICNFIQGLDFLAEKKLENAPTIEVEDLEEDLVEFKTKFQESMDDDFNSAGAIAAIFKMIHFCNKALEEGGYESECLSVMKSSVLELCEILGLKILAPKQALPDKKIEGLIEDRNQARKNKDFKMADQIRDQLKDLGIEIEDTPYGTRWKELSS
jgi:cysteinyl-tRNA synthetase